MLNELDEVFRAVVTPKEAFSVPRMKSVYNHRTKNWPQSQSRQTLEISIALGGVKALKLQEKVKKCKVEV